MYCQEALLLLPQRPRSVLNYVPCPSEVLVTIRSKSGWYGSPASHLTSQQESGPGSLHSVHLLRQLSWPMQQQSGLLCRHGHDAGYDVCVV